MAQVTIAIHGKTYNIACDDGQEARVQELGKYIDMRFREIAGAGAASTEPLATALTAMRSSRLGVCTVPGQMALQRMPRVT